MARNGSLATLQNDASEENKGERRPVALLISIGLLYISFGVTFGVLQGGLPPVLRSRGVDVGSLGWLVAILLPFGLTFLWAPFIDRFSFSKHRPHIAWIAAMQLCVGLLLLAMAYWGGRSMAVLFLLALGIAFAAATMDIALDGLAAGCVRPSDRVFAGGMKVGSLSIGAIIGGGLFVTYFNRLGWSNLFLFIAALTFLAALPILAQSERQYASVGKTSQRPSLFTTFRQADHRRHVLILSVLSVPLAMMFGLNRVMLVDAKVPLEQIGSIVGTLSPLGSLAATLVAVAVMRRSGAFLALAVFTGVSLLAAALTVAAFVVDEAAVLSVPGAILATSGSSGFYVVICTMVLGWANTNQAATDYAALYGISRLFGMIILMLAAQAVPVVGWGAFYGAAALALIGALFVFGRLVVAEVDGKAGHVGHSPNAKDGL